MNFNDVVPEDYRWAKSLLNAPGYTSCEYAFVNIYMWKKIHNTKIARFEDFVVARSEGRRRMQYLYPAGTGDISRVLNAIMQDAEQKEKEPVFFSLREDAKNELEALYPDKFTYSKPAGESDYIYLSEELANLAGRKFQKKRNFCARFERENPDWEFKEITPESMDAICEFNNVWCNLYDNRGDEGIAEEHRAIELVCRHYDELCVKGGYVTVNGKVVAFSFGSYLGGDMFVTHVEKALYNIIGAYNIINREIARHFAKECTYINRENDVDEEGLRKAKLSYNPVQIEEKYIAELKK